MMRRRVLFVIIFGIYQAASICTNIERNQLEFCSMVNYSTTGDSKSDDTRAKSMHNRLVQTVSQFDCRKTFGLNTCDDCKDAYKYWLCSTIFPQCGEHGMKKVS